jgi:hypothetical protein
MLPHRVDENGPRRVGSENFDHWPPERLQGEEPSEVFGPSESDHQWLAENSRPPIHSGHDLIVAVAEFLSSVGLEPDVQGDSVGFLFLGRLHRIELEDIESRLERQQVSEDELAMLAAGLAVG